MYVQMNNLTTLRTGRQFRLTVHRRGPLILSYESFFPNMDHLPITGLIYHYSSS